MEKYFNYSIGEVNKIKKEYLGFISEKTNKIKEFTEKYIKDNFYFDDIPSNERICRDSIIKIYFVSGIFHAKAKTKVWKKKFNKEFLRRDKEYFDDVFYFYLEENKIKNIIKKLKNDLERTQRENKKDFFENNKKIIIFAHSFGGIISKTAISQLDKKYRDNIILITMATPHKIDYFKIDSVKKKLKTPEDIDCFKVFSFGGIYDTVVPVKLSHNNKSLKKDLYAEHLMFLYSDKIINEIFENIFKN